MILLLSIGDLHLDLFFIPQLCRGLCVVVPPFISLGLWAGAEISSCTEQFTGHKAISGQLLKNIPFQITKQIRLSLA